MIYLGKEWEAWTLVLYVKSVFILGESKFWLHECEARCCWEKACMFSKILVVSRLNIHILFCPSLYPSILLSVPSHRWGHDAEPPFPSGNPAEGWLRYQRSQRNHMARAHVNAKQALACNSTKRVGEETPPVITSSCSTPCQPVHTHTQTHTHRQWEGSAWPPNGMGWG